VPSVRRAEPHEAEAVARLIADFRDHMGLDGPSDPAVRPGVERYEAAGFSATNNPYGSRDLYMRLHLD
jgi:hypothetical protein